MYRRATLRSDLFTSNGFRWKPISKIINTEFCKETDECCVPSLNGCVYFGISSRKLWITETEWIEGPVWKGEQMVGENLKRAILSNCVEGFIMDFQHILLPSCRDYLCVEPSHQLIYPRTIDVRDFLDNIQKGKRTSMRSQSFWRYR